MPAAALEVTLCHLLSQACIRTPHTPHRMDNAVHYCTHFEVRIWHWPYQIQDHVRVQQEFHIGQGQGGRTVGGRRCCLCHKWMMQRSLLPGQEPLWLAVNSLQSCRSTASSSGNYQTRLGSVSISPLCPSHSRFQCSGSLTYR